MNVRALKLAAIAAAPLFAAAHAQAPDCSRLPAIDGPMGYGTREGHVRCEGFFEAPVGSAAVEVVFALAAPLDFDPATDAALLVAAPAGPSLDAGPLAVTAVALSPQTYYRMDARLDGDAPLRWPLDAVVRPAALEPHDLGIWAWTERAGETVYVPVIVSVEGRAAQAPALGTPVLGLRAATALERVMWRAQAEDGPVGDWTVLAEGPLFAGDILRLEVPAGDASPARLEIAAMQRATGRWLRRDVHVWRAAR